MAASKPLLIPWLREQIDSGCYPGVHWTNDERTEFCIPWKHALRQDSNSEDVLIFKAWAETSLGKQSDGRTPGDPSVWKRNFRAALRARGFSLLHDNKKDVANPHKIYHWPRGEGAMSGASCEASPELDSPPDTDPLPVFEHIYLAEDAFSQNNNGSDILQQCMGELQIYEPLAALPLAAGESVLLYTMAGPETDCALLEESCPVQETLGGVLQSPLFLPEVVQQGPHIEPPQVEEIQPEAAAPESTPFKTCFKVVVHYRGHLEMEELVTDESGFRLAYRPEDCLHSDPVLRTVFLPEPDGIRDETQANLSRQILRSLGGGLELRVIGSVLHGRRQGDSKVFWSVDKHDQSRTPRELTKYEAEPLFSFKDFIQEFMGFVNKQCKCPPISLIFCLGERWPDPKLKPWDKKLIMVEVIFDALENLKSMALDGGASSLQSSVELQISLDQMMMDMS